MKKIVIYLQMLLLSGVLLSTFSACSKDNDDKEKIQNNEKVKKEQVIGTWDGVAVGIMNGTKETTIDQEMAYWKAQGSNDDYIKILEDIKKQYEDMLRISFKDNNTILVEYTGDVLEDEQGTWLISPLGLCNINYGSGNFAISSDLIISEDGKAYFYAQKKLMKIYIKILEN